MDGSNFVSGVGVPPLALTCMSAAVGAGENTITPPGPHAPPRPIVTSQTTCDAPPSISIVFNLFPAKYPMERPSGDQNGKIASLVSGSARASLEFMGRTQTDVFPSTIAVKAK